MANNDTRPGMFLDVDGVVCPYDDNPPTWDDWKTIHTGAFRAPWSPKMIAALAALDCEIMWCSTWLGMTTEHLNPAIGWDVPYLGEEALLNDHHRSRNWWKQRAVENWTERHPGRAVLWIDDHLTNTARTRAVAALRTRGVTYKILAPDRGSGLTPANLDSLARWRRQIAQTHAH